MTIKIENKVISIYSGDSGSFTASGIPTDNDYECYFEVRDTSGNTIFEQMVKSNQQDSVTFTMTVEDTDKFAPAEGKKTASYTWGIKVCNAATGEENTAFLSGSTFGDTYKLIAYAEIVEGLDG